MVISKPADNYLRAAHYLLFLLSLNGRAGQITRETNYLWVTIFGVKIFPSTNCPYYGVNVTCFGKSVKIFTGEFAILHGP